jgi:hypothetical protein
MRSAIGRGMRKPVPKRKTPSVTVGRMDYEARGAAGDADCTRSRKNAGVVACYGGAFDVART